jgi:hypothetical protein
MSDHVSREQIEGFCARTLDTAELTAVGGHIAWCEPCFHLFQEVFQRRRNYAPVRINLSPEHWFKDEHLDYEQLVDFMDERMDEEEREITSVHLQACARCRGDVHSFLAYRQEIEPEMQVRYAPDKDRAITGKLLDLWNWPRSLWKPVYAAAVLAVLGAVVTASILFWRERAGNQQIQKVSTHTTDVTPTPLALASASPAAAKLIGESTHPSENSTPTQTGAGLKASQSTERQPRIASDVTVGKRDSSTERIILLKDNGANLKVDPSGGIVGLNNLSPGIQRPIKEALLAAEIRKPEVLAELTGVQGPVRGTTESKTSFKLLSPSGVVLFSDRPVFKWEPLEGATGYRILVADAANQEAAASGPLSSATTQWTPSVALRRGGIYTWVVIATVNGTEVTAPAATAPEMRFKLLDDGKVRELNLLRRSTKSHLALGVFYAREGMLAEAEQEFQQLVNDNPESPVAVKLLRTVQSWRR